MITIKFIIRKMEDSKEQPIYITTRFGRNEKLMYATPLKIKAAFWDKNGKDLKTPSIVRIKTNITQCWRV